MEPLVTVQLQLHSDFSFLLARRRVSVTSLLDQVFPEFETQFDSIFCKTVLAVLKQYPIPEKLSRAQAGKLTEVLQVASNGRFGEWKARQLKELAGDSFGIPDCEGAYSTLLLMYLDQLQSLKDGAASLEHKIGELFSKFDSTLTSITGIGPVLAAIILSEIRDISCFASADNQVFLHQPVSTLLSMKSKRRFCDTIPAMRPCVPLRFG